MGELRANVRVVAVHSPTASGASSTAGMPRGDAGAELASRSGHGGSRRSPAPRGERPVRRVQLGAGAPVRPEQPGPLPVGPAWSRGAAGHGSFALPQALDGLDATARFVQLVRGVVLARPGRSWASHHAALAVHGLPLHEVDTAAVDAALHAGLVDDAALAAAMDRAPLGPRQRAKAEAVLAMADPRCESPGESLTRILLVGLAPPVRSQVNIRDEAGLIGRVDFLVGERVVVEFDGMVKYAGADGRQALAAEKRRKDRLRAAGYQVVRLTWADLHHPDRVARAIRQAMARAAAR